MCEKGPKNRSGVLWGAVVEPTRKHYRALAAISLTALEASGFRVVPVEPDARMYEAGGDAFALGDLKLPADVWAAMLNAAPKVTP